MIEIKEYHIVEGRGLSILFSISGNLYRRVSDLTTKALLWWKEEGTNEYVQDERAEELEGMAKSFLIGYKFKDIDQRQLK